MKIKYEILDFEKKCILQLKIIKHYTFHLSKMLIRKKVSIKYYFLESMKYLYLSCLIDINTFYTSRNNNKKK